MKKGGTQILVFSDHKSDQIYETLINSSTIPECSAPAHSITVLQILGGNGLDQKKK